MKNYGIEKMEKSRVENNLIDTLFDFKVDETYIEVAKGSATYQMKRGTFKTKDKLKDITKLFYAGLIDDKYHFTNGKVNLNLQVTHNDVYQINFEIDQDYNRLTLFLNSTDNEKFYGCGEQYASFNLKKKKVSIWVSEHHSLKKLLTKFIRETVFGRNPNYLGKFKNHQTYYVQPTFMSSHKYFIHFDTKSFATFHFSQNKTKLHFREIPKTMIVGTKDNFLDLSSLLSSVLGKQPKLPSWTEKGAILAIQGGTDLIKEKVLNALKHGVEISAIWSQDWSGHLVTSFGYQVNWNWAVDEKNYHDIHELVSWLSDKNIRFMGYINTFLKESSSLYLEAKIKNYLVLNQDHLPYLIKSTTFKAGIVDLTNPDAFQWYKEIIKHNMIELGMSGWMADFGEYLPTDAIIHSGSAEIMHNIWPTLWAKCNHDAIIESHKQDEVFFFSRAGYTDTLKYTNSMWSGDQHVDFSKAYGLPSVITSTLGMATTGIGISHSDIGGYTTILHMKRNIDLMMRWTEMNVFSPLFRCHEGNKPDINIQFDHPNMIDHFARMSKIYKALSPYLSDIKNTYYHLGIPVIRPIFYEDEQDIFFETDDAYMFGPDLLVAPIIKPNSMSRKVNLPKGDWVHLFTKITYHSGYHNIEAPYGQPIVFYKKNSPYNELFETI